MEPHSSKLESDNSFSSVSDLKVSEREYQQQINNTIRVIKRTKLASETFLKILKDIKANTKDIEDIANKVQLKLDDVPLMSEFSPGFPQFQTSCLAIQQHDPTSKSGYYFVKSPSNQLQSVYCKMENCGDSKGPWIRVVNLNISKCPAGLKTFLHRGISTCIVESDAPGCTELSYPTLGMPYSKICGRITTYPIGTLDGFVRRNVKANTLYDNYVDGIKLISNKQHVWTFAAGKCKCSSSDKKIPRFIRSQKYWTCSTVLSEQHTIWKYQQCNTKKKWFGRKLRRTAADIKVSICRDQQRSEEDLALKTMVIYVQ